MRFFKILIAFMILLPPTECYSQSSILQLGLWNISALSGEVKLGALYGTGDINTYGIKNKINTFNYYGGLLVKSSSYIWNPNFLTVDIDGGYYPESRQDLYLVSPNVYNVINTQKLHIRTTLFPKKQITLTTYLNFDNSYDSRENLTDIKTKSKSYGGTSSYRNSIVPLTFAYNQTEWDSKEILSGRDFYYNQKSIEGRATRSLGQSDKNDLLYTHYDYLREDYSLYAIRNISDNLQLMNGYYLDSAHRSYFNSNIMGTTQRGNDSFNQFRANENLLYKLPHNLTFNASYGYYYIERQPERLGQHSVNGLLGHQLFESLHSSILYEYNNAQESSYHEVNDRIGLDLNYTKKTFANGLLNIIYSYSRGFERRTSTDVLLNILNEEYTISDRVLLKKPYINASSIIIKDATGTAIYQVGLDYLVNAIGNFIEIQRIPGGLIQENTRIYVFYNATQPGTYQYDINLQNFTINYSIFKNLLDFYYKTNKTDFDNIHNADYLLLNYLTENIYGSSFKYRSATAGMEYDDYKSNLVPYKMTRYFLTWQGNYEQRILFSVNANWRDYKIPTEETDRIYKDINGMISYSFGRKSKLDVTIGYQSQRGKQINLDLFTARSKFSTIIKQLTFVAGLDSYNRIYLDNQKTNYIGMYFQVIKKFKY